ncbi:hypothetical protein PFISCL1PPCAC_3138, partial [Pristionchus fissidentatus]
LFISTMFFTTHRSFLLKHWIGDKSFTIGDDIFIFGGDDLLKPKLLRINTNNFQMQQVPCKFEPRHIRKRFKDVAAPLVHDNRVYLMGKKFDFLLMGVPTGAGFHWKNMKVDRNGIRPYYGNYDDQVEPFSLIFADTSGDVPSFKEFYIQRNHPYILGVFCLRTLDLQTLQCSQEYITMDEGERCLMGKWPWQTFVCGRTAHFFKVECSRQYLSHVALDLDTLVMTQKPMTINSYIQPTLCRICELRAIAFWCNDAILM